MLWIILSVVLWLPPLVGLGSPFVLACESAGMRLAPLMRMAIAGLLGFFVLAMSAIAVNFRWPLYPLMPCVAWASGLALALANGKRLWAGIGGWALGALLAVIVFLSATAFRERILYDTGLYHLQTVRWMTDARLPLGLANLHLRLGYNSAWHAAAAALEGPGLLGKSAFVAPTLLLACWSLALFFAIGQLLRGRVTVANLLLAASVYPIVVWAVHMDICPQFIALSNDLPAMLLVILSLALIVQDNEEAKGDLTAALLAALLALFATLAKLSSAPLVPLAAGVCWWRWRRLNANRRHLAAVAAIGLAAGLLWMIRGYGLSGYPAFPSSWGGLANASWKVPLHKVVEEKTTIVSWARTGEMPSNKYVGWQWTGPWFHSRICRPPILVLSLAGLAGLTMLVTARWWRRGVRIRGRVWAAAATCVAALLYWFFTAPDPRFAYGFIFGLAALVAAAGLVSLQPPPLPVVLRWTLLGIVCAAIVAGAGIKDFLPRLSWLHWPALPEAALVHCRTKQGVGIWVPAVGNQAWRAPLPNTPLFNPDLRCSIRSPQRIRRFYEIPASR